MNTAAKRESDTSAPELDALTTHVSDEEEAHAQAHERKVREQARKQLDRLQDEARAIYGMVEGRPGVTSPAQWQKLLERAGDYVGNGRFLVRCLGAERYLDAETVAVLITLRQNLIAELPHPSTADLMMIDAAVVAYYNMLRVQGWIGNLAIVVEGKAFGRAALDEIHGTTVGRELEEHLARLVDVMLPLQDRCHRMMVRSLAQLPRSGSKPRLFPVPAAQEAPQTAP